MAMLTEQPLPHNAVSPSVTTGDVVDMTRVIRRIWASRWWIITISATFFMLAMIYSFIPIPYAATSMIRIEPEISTAGEMTDVDAEIGVINSWAMVENTLEVMQRNVEVVPQDSPARRFTLFLNYILSKFTNKTLPADYGDSATIEIDHFITPEGLENKPLFLKVGREGSYVIFDAAQRPLIAGEEGRKASITLQNFSENNAKLEVSVKQINAQEGHQFVLIPRSLSIMTSMVKHSLIGNKRGFNPMSGLVEISFTHHDKIFAQQFLSYFVNSYLNQAYNRSALGKMKALNHLRVQTDNNREQMEMAEKELALFRAEAGTIDLNSEAKQMVVQMNSLEDQMMALRSRRAELLVTYTENHPSILAVDEQLVFFTDRMRELELRASRLPSVQNTLLQLQRELKTYNRLYDMSINAVAQLETEVEGLTGYSRLVNPSRLKPRVFVSRVIKMSVVGGVLGGLIGIAIIFMLSTPALARVIEKEDISTIAEQPVLATIPKMRLKKPLWNQLMDFLNLIHKKTNHTKLTDELLENQRQSEELIYLNQRFDFVTFGAKNPIIFVTSHIESQGASLFAEHLSTLRAQRTKTILVDADIVHSRFYKEYGVNRSPGLSDILVGKATINESVVFIEKLGLYYLPPGTENPTFHLLMNQERLRQVFLYLTADYKNIVIDFPPLPQHLRKKFDYNMAGTIFHIIRKHAHIASAARALAEYPQKPGLVQGIIMNEV